MSRCLNLNARKLMREMQGMTIEQRGQYITLICESKLTQVNQSPEVNKPEMQLTYHEDKPYRYPTAPHALVVSCYKVLLGFKQEDRDWDDRNFDRFSKTAVKLLHIREFQNSWERVADYMDSFAQDYRKKGIPFTMETMYKNYDVWRLEHGACISPAA